MVWPANQRLRVIGQGGVALLALGLLYAGGLGRLENLATEAAVREGICQRLLDNSTAGRQGLISSIWWAPFPTLCRLPLVELCGTALPGLASLVVSASFGVAALALLNLIFRQWNLGWPRWLILGGLAAHPLYLQACLNGSSDTLGIFLVLLTTHGLLLWMEAHKLRGLVLLGIGAALLLLSSLALAAWLTIVLVLLAVHQFRRAATPVETEAVMILAIWPGLYALGIWILANWLVLGDGVYFLRSLLTEIPPPPASAARHLNAPLRAYWPIGGAALILAIALRRREPTGVALALLGIGPLIGAWFFVSRGYGWDLPVILFSLLPLGVLAVGWLAAQESGCKLMLLAAAPLLLTAVLCWTPFRTGTVVPPAAPDRAAHRADAVTPLLAAINAEVQPSLPFARVFVCGYGSLALLGPRPAPLFIPALDFNINQAVRNYRGYHLYILTPRPTGIAAAESIHWKYPALYARGHRNILFYHDWPDWRLFEIIQAPRHETPVSIAPTRRETVERRGE